MVGPAAGGGEGCARRPDHEFSWLGKYESGETGRLEHMPDRDARMTDAEAAARGFEHASSVGQDARAGHVEEDDALEVEVDGRDTGGDQTGESTGERARRNRVDRTAHVRFALRQLTFPASTQRWKSST